MKRFAAEKKNEKERENVRDFLGSKMPLFGIGFQTQFFGGKCFKIKNKKQKV